MLCIALDRQLLQHVVISCGPNLTWSINGELGQSIDTHFPAG